MKKFSDIIENTYVHDLQKHARKRQENSFKIMKSDDEKMQAFGWASVSIRVDGEVIEDWQKDIVEPEELELNDAPFLAGHSSITSCIL